MVEATGFEPAASASRTQRSTKLSHASISINFGATKHDLFRICGVLCGRSGICRYPINTVPPIKWIFVRGSEIRKVLDQSLGICFRTQLTLAVPRIFFGFGAPKDFNRFACSLSLNPPTLAVKLKTTKMSQMSIMLFNIKTTLLYIKV